MRSRASVSTLAILAACTLLRAAAPGSAQSRAAGQSSFAGQIASLSEPGGYFDTDNLISNESSYLQVIPELHARGVHGGAYIGVGPDQNFTYIAQVKPAVAYIVDIRRDNLLLHLFFKALFELSRNREEYLSMLFGRRLPAAAGRRTRGAGIEDLVKEIDRRPADPADVASVRTRVKAIVQRSGVPLSSQDLATMMRFHSRFVEEGLSLQFQSIGRPPQSHYPTYRQLLLDTDPAGHHSNFLGSEEGFQFVKTLQAQDRVIPVVGDLSGASALEGIADALGRRRELLSAVYVSNVEFYLFRQGTFQRWIRNLELLPHQKNAVVIRSVFDWYARVRAGDSSASRLQSVEDLLAAFARGRIQRYSDITQ